MYPLLAFVDFSSNHCITKHIEQGTVFRHMYVHHDMLSRKSVATDELIDMWFMNKGQRSSGFFAIRFGVSRFVNRDSIQDSLSVIA